MSHEQTHPLPSYTDAFNRIAISDDPRVQQGKFIGQEFPLAVNVHVDPHTNGVVVINYPGLSGDIDGYANKYAKLGSFLQERVGAVVRTDNHVYVGFTYSTSVQDHLRAVIGYTLDHSTAIAGKTREETDMYLMGFSAGASAIAAVAHEYPAVKKILLMALSGDAGEEAVRNGLGKYTGECHVVVGENDRVVGVEGVKLIASLATAASVLRTAIIPDCDHQFKGETNGRIMSAAPLWAFQGAGQAIPRPEDGIVLYT